MIQGKNEAIEEILQALRIEHKDNIDQGFTVKEIEAYTGSGNHVASRLIDEMLAKGLVQPGRIKRMNRAGILTSVIGYIPTAKAQDKATTQS